MEGSVISMRAPGPSTAQVTGLQALRHGPQVALCRTVPEPSYALNRLERDGAPVLELSGKLTFEQAPGLWTEVSASLEGVAKGERLDFDVSKLEEALTPRTRMLLPLIENYKSAICSSSIGALHTTAIFPT